MISRDDDSAACKETLYCAEYKACFFASLPRLFSLSRAGRACASAAFPVFLVELSFARAFGGAHARAAFACRRRSIPQEWAAAENPAAALLPPDSLVADLTALAQGRSVDTKKLRFVETPLFDSQQIARVYRDDGLFFGAVKIEGDAARTHACCHNRHLKRQLRPQRAELSLFASAVRKELPQTSTRSTHQECESLPIATFPRH